MNAQHRVPTLTTAQTQEVERLLAAEYRIGLPQLLENAGRAATQLARRLLEGDLLDRPIVVLAGRGNNGGSGLAAARHLINGGAWVQVICSYPAGQYKGAPGQQLAALHAMGAALSWAEEGWELPPADLVIDAVIGYGLRGDPRGKGRDLIQLANSNRAPILSLETPSGVDTAAGRLYTPHVQAAATLALGLPQGGLRQPAAQAACGAPFLASIGVPASLYAGLGLELPPALFARDEIVPLHVVDGEFYVDA